MTNNIHPDLKSGNLVVGISDHLPSFMIVPKKTQNYLPKKHNIYKRDTKNFDKENFILDYLDINWEEYLNTEDVNEATEKFIAKMNELIDKYTPLRKITQEEYKRRLKPWITQHITNKIKEKNKILSKIVKCKNQNEKAVLNEEFKNMRNEITRLTRINKKITMTNILLSTKIILAKPGRASKKSSTLKVRSQTSQAA